MDINKQIEEASKDNHAGSFNRDSIWLQDKSFKAGANFILNKFRWRKVSEELPELGVEVLITRNDGIRFLSWLDKDSELFFNVSGNEEYFLDEIQSWKPID